MQPAFTYPPMPLGANEAVIKPSASFRNSVIRVTLAILLFVLTYLIMFILAVGIAVALGYFGIFLVTASASFLTAVLCAGFISGGVMLVYFLIKFLFKRTDADQSNKIEITQEEQPELFAFIKKLTAEASAPFPKRIFVSAEVNAAVFYRSGFWSMFLPVKKNLNIGLGLVNTLNLSEFKAVMAHEFGHFSQRSMKFGSYVYNMNRVIFNMLFDNEGYGNAINKIASLHSFIRLGIFINLQLIRAIQFVLRQVYTLINKQYMGLSREMEFHADAVSAYVAGSNQCINCLHRSELGQHCYNNTISLLNKLAVQKKRTANLYVQHLEEMRTFGKRQHLALDGAGIPVINRRVAALNNSEIEVGNQWASHPSNTDREDKLNSINLVTPTVEEPAWVLFRNAEALQAMVTNMLYNDEAAHYQKESTEAISQFKADNDVEYTYNPLYRGYYDNRMITEFNVEEAVAKTDGATGAITSLLTDEHCNLPERINGLQADIELLEAIDTADHIKTFDFRGYKYGRHDTYLVRKSLEEELMQARARLEALDERLFIACYKAAANPHDISTGYIALFDCQRETTRQMELYNKMLAEIKPVYSSRQLDDIERGMKRLYKQEEEFKETLRSVFEDERYQNTFRNEERANVETYLSKQWIYFKRPKYDEDALEVLNHATDAYYRAVYQRYYLVKKALLELQLLPVAMPSDLNKSLT